MRLFGVGTGSVTTIGHPASTTATASVPPHPSAPIPVQGPGIGSCLRVDLGETGIRTFPLILGGAEFGWNADADAAHRILDRYAEFGGNAVHTADSFAAGRSEYIIGRWLASRGNREDIVLCARVGGHPDHVGLGAVNLVRAVEDSLTRLGVAHIDVLYLDGTIDDGSALEDTLATAEWLVETGKVRVIGAFGFSPERLVEARILASAGYPRIEVLDEPYNLVRRTGFEGDLRLVAAAQGLAVTPSHALEHGFLSGRHRSKQALQGVRGVQLRSNINRRGIKVLRALDLIAQEAQAPVAAVAIAWLLAQRTVTAPIVNAFAAEQVDELMQGAGVSLGRGQIADLTRAAS
ncbi:MAG: aldo/keto reductase [Actinobacteria bacterium]|nr:aldo/keto reductase [Actinomycetota bacterium]